MINRFCLLAVALPTFLFSQSFARGDVTVTPVGAPVFDIVDTHLFAAPTDIFGSLFPLHFPNRTIHLPPYDQELADGLALNGISDGVVFSVPDFTNPNAVHLGYVLQPNASAPNGSSPDYASGPILPNPILIRGDVYLNGAPFELMAFNLTPSPGTGIDGASHYVVDVWENNTFAPPGLPSLVGDYEYRLTLRDAVDSSGYDMVAQFSVVPEPGSLTLIGLGAAFAAGWSLRRRTLLERQDPRLG